MKHKFSSMGRVAIALVLALSLVLVMAVPVAADVSEPAVTNDPETVGRAAEYTVIFTTNSALLAALDQTITITFPENTFVPSGTAAYDGNVTVNTVDCADGAVSGSGQAVTIIVPQDVSAGTVTVVIAVDAGIKNPTTTATTWILTVQTTEEPEPVDSGVYDTIAVVVPTITGVVGTTYQNSNDTIVISFSEAVAPADGTWSADEFSSVVIDPTALTLTGADFAYAAKVLTITLSEADDEYLVKDKVLTVTPAEDAIENEFGDAVVAVTPKTHSVVGDSVAPTVALTYSPDRPVKDADTLVITATFSEAMAATPTIAIVYAGGEDLAATDMTGSGATWTYDYNVPAGSNDLDADVTIVGDDLAGNPVGAGPHDDFPIDNTLPVITDVATDIIGTAISGAGDTIEISFSEAVAAADGTWSANELTIESVVGTGDDAVSTPVTLTNAVFEKDDPEEDFTTTLTITLDEATDGEYLVTVDERLTVTPVADAILDAALNAMAITAKEGTTAVGGDATAPTITEIVGVGTSAIRITFDEAVVAADGTWSANEFDLIESPDTAPLNINHATFTPNNDPGTGMATVLTITLNEAVDGASLVAGVDIYVTPATAIVDLAGVAYAAGKVDSSTDADWLEVWVDDDFDSETDGWSVTHFNLIEDGIAAVAIDGTVNVAAGTYTPSSTLTIATVGLTLQSTDGAGVTIINVAVTDPSYDILITASDVTVDGFTVENPVHAIQVTGADATVINNVITRESGYPEVWIASTASGATVSGNELATEVTMMMMGVSNVTLSDNTFGAGINLNSNSGIDITGNYIIGSEYVGIKFDGGSFDDILIQGNTIADTTIGDAEDAAIAFWDAVVTVTNVTITGNDITDNADAGIRIGTVTWGTGNVINNNNITGNDGGVTPFYGIENLSGVLVDATLNWWGDANGPNQTGDAVSTNVAYSPWLDALCPYGKSTTTTDHYAIDLAVGWNLISLPLIPTNANILTVLADIVDNVDSVYSYNPDGSWSYFIPDVSQGLTEMNDGEGFWVKMTAADVLVVSGYELCAPAPAVPPEYEVVAGWNLIGFKFTTANGIINSYLGDVGGTNLQAIYGYNADTGAYTIPTDLDPGCGYWIALTLGGTIYPEFEVAP